MQVRNYVRILWRWRWLIVLVALTCAVTSLLLSLQLPKKYASVSVALVNPKQPISTPGVTDPSQLPNSDQLVATYAALVNSGPVRRRLADSGVPRTDDELRSEISAVRQPDTTLISITATDRDPAVALLIAKTIVPTFNQSLTELQQQVQQSSNTSTLDSLVPWDVPIAAPGAPVSPNIPGNVLAALAAGLLAGGGIAMFIERLDDRIKSEVEVRTRLGLPLLGMVRYATRPGDADESDIAVELTTARQIASPVSEAFKAIRTNILFSRVDQPLRSIVITSTVPSEGKTTTACNLAAAMALAGTKVILVDADFRRPALKNVFKCPGAMGLSNLIIGEVELDDVLAETGTTNLAVLPSGTNPPNPSELLGSSSMARTMQDLLQVADVVIFDTPPIAAVTDATVMAASCDAVILVIEQRRAPVQKIVDALETLDAIKASVVGAVLNKARVGRGEPDYYTYYGQPANGQSTVALAPAGLPTTPVAVRRGRPGRSPRPAGTPPAEVTADVKPAGNSS